MARDLEADLKLCEAATPGPWVCRHPFRMSREPAPNPSIVECDHPIGSVAHCYGSNFADADFIAAARTGWPETIRELKQSRKRITELEAENVGLKEDNEYLREELAALEVRLEEMMNEQENQPL